MQEESKTESIDLMDIFEAKDDLLDMLQRDKDFYEGQDRKMRMKVAHLCRQLEEAQQEALKYKRLMDEINGNKYNPSEVLRIADQLGISANSEDRYPGLFASRKDSSVDDQHSITDSSSFVSGEDSSFSLDSKRSFSNEQRQSFDSDMQAYVRSPSLNL